MVTRQALNRELKALEALRAIDIAYSQITVLDHALLEAAAEAPGNAPQFS